MLKFAALSGMSPLPIVDLDAISQPIDGLVVPTPEQCRRHFKKGDACRNHYEKLAADSDTDCTLVQCPFGFASYPFRSKNLHIALTSVVPYPRLGGDAERAAAKATPDSKIPAERIPQVEKMIKEVEERVENLERATVDGQSVALHEIRKLNRTIKQASERMCLAESPHDPDRANRELVAIWKSAEIMSLQFDVIEILANESLVRLPVNSLGEIYRIFDKCARIYNCALESNRIRLVAPSGFNLQVAVCDKTITMIPTALIENAIKYSLPNSEILIEFYTNRGTCNVEVKNLARLDVPLTDDVFRKGVRLGVEKEGSGNGLYLARLVAAQHHAQLTVSTRKIGFQEFDCIFRLSIPEFRGRRY